MDNAAVNRITRLQKELTVFPQFLQKKKHASILDYRLTTPSFQNDQITHELTIIPGASDRNRTHTYSVN
jgi:hypothetical protein